MLVTPSDRLHPDTAAALGSIGPEFIEVLGGEAAIPNDVVAALPDDHPGRTAGSTRDETAKLIALTHDSSGIDNGRVAVIDGWSEDAWGYGLAAAGLASDAGAAVVTARPGRPLPTPSDRVASGHAILAVGDSTADWGLGALHDGIVPARPFDDFDICAVIDPLVGPPLFPGPVDLERHGFDAVNPTWPTDCIVLPSQGGGMPGLAVWLRLDRHETGDREITVPGADSVWIMHNEIEGKPRTVLEANLDSGGQLMLSCWRRKRASPEQVAVLVEMLTDVVAEYHRQ